MLSAAAPAGVLTLREPRELRAPRPVRRAAVLSAAPRYASLRGRPMPPAWLAAIRRGQGLRPAREGTTRGRRIDGTRAQCVVTDQEAQCGIATREAPEDAKIAELPGDAVDAATQKAGGHLPTTRIDTVPSSSLSLVLHDLSAPW